MGRVRTVSIMLLEKHRDKFSSSFEENKAVITQLASIRSKKLRNEVAGYITHVMAKGMGGEKAEEGEEEGVGEVEGQTSKGT